MATSSSSFIKYGYEFPAGTEELEVEFWCLQQGREWLEKQGRNLFMHYANCHKLLWPEDAHHRWFNQMLKSFCDEEITVLLGCGDCVSGDTKILDPITGESPTIKSLCEAQTAPMVMTLNGPELADIPYLKGQDVLYEFVLENGHRFKCTGNHLLLSGRSFCRASSLRTGERLFSYEPIHHRSTSVFSPPIQAANAHSFQKKAEDYRDDYSTCFCHDDEQLHLAIKAARSSSPLQVCALKRKNSDSDLDGWEKKCKHTRALSRFCPHANSHSLSQENLAGIPSESRFLQRNLLPDSQLSQQHGQWPLENSHQKSFSAPILCASHNELFRDSNWLSSQLRVTETKIVSISKSQRDDFYDITVPVSGHYFADGVIHHNSAKTYGMSCFALIDYWAFPQQTLWMVSSTEYRGCELRIWGEIKMLFNRAKDRYPWLAGHPLESMHAITTDEIDDDRQYARSLKTGLILVPCKKGSQYVGLAAFQGVKALRLRHAGDEVAAMEEGFLNAYTNWYGKRDFKGLMAGNPTDPEDQLCRAAEPMEGWDHFVDTGKTQEWRSKFFNAHVIALDGRDSPNNDFPDSKLPKYHFLISRKKLDAVAATYGTDSWQWYSQCIGKPNKSVLLFRVITRQQCLENHALEEVVWIGEPLTSVYALDPNYGGQDRCVGGKIDFGKDVDGNEIISFHAPEIIPIKPAINPGDREPETQIARHVKLRLEEHSIPAKNCFYDATGKGTLGFAFAKEFGALCPVPIDSGAKATTRPVRFDLFVEEKNKQRRLKRCDEHYNKFVTEMWFSVSEAILSGQIRGLPMDVMKELCLRTYSIGKGNHIEIEPKSGTPNKPGFIQRIGYSPDLGDWAAFCVEGARRLGFQIKRLGNDLQSDDDGFNWLEEWQSKHEKLLRSRELTRT